MKKMIESTQIQRGTPGNQNPMYTPNAVTSAKQTTTISRAYVQPVRNPASGPMYCVAYSPNDPATGLRTAISPSDRNTM
ncbi:Uncharacterised protein [Mycobacteroides abscessus subsp. massiliense]|nr:Uncharacterised protein [Mycobacteroides abscessus subsp. massiliense]